MNKTEAKKILSDELDVYRSRSFEELVHLIKDPITYEKIGDSGLKYQIEVQANWDDEEKKDLRIVGSIDDCEWRAFFPLTISFIVEENRETGGK